MNTVAHCNMGNMVLSNSGMPTMGSGGNCMIKQQIGGGPGNMLNAGSVGPGGNLGPNVGGGPNQGMHMGGPGAHPGQVMQNGPMMRMVGQQHMIRGPNPHLIGNGPGGPRMQNPNMTIGNYTKYFHFL